MAKTVSQETFDSVVKENIEDFSMSAEEAVTDAVEQFHAQGVDLSNIVKDLSITQTEGGAQHAVVQAITSLRTSLSKDPIELPPIKESLLKITAECDIDLAHRCLAGTNNAYPALLAACETLESGMLERCLTAMCALCNGQPDLLEEKGLQLMLEVLRSNDNSDIVLLVTKFIRLTCIKHEKNRQSYVGADLIPALVKSLSKHKQHKEIVRETCAALRVLTFDDDVRVPFGKAHDHAKIIVTEAGALEKIMVICREYMSEKSVLGELFSTLSCLAVRNEFCQQIMDLGGLELMLDTLEKNMDHPGITRQVMGVLKAIAGNDDVKVATVNHGGLELIVSALSKHALHSGICDVGCGAIATIVLRNPAHCKRAMDAGAADVIVKVFHLHKKEESVQKQACMATRNLVARTREYSDRFVELGIESLIRDTYSTHTSCKDEAKAALRDLDLKVDLKELWKGEGRGIQA